MKRCTITHFELDTDQGGWHVRFRGDAAAFTMMTIVLRAWRRDNAYWQPDYCWPDGRVGAWWMTGRVVVACFPEVGNIGAFWERHRAERSQYPIPTWACAEPGVHRPEWYYREGRFWCPVCSQVVSGEQERRAG